ncbi:hypothetical protein GQR60_06610 [Labilibaculum sp. A4]|uniref:hypothetical protein n=1 Tax=Labilibaculum euxinus TaxID=2686357 RepID=UPI000F61A2CE|nr:hypothetical protein [Labilibaculum euxinus]MDQ1770832.1 hypothetical protein [Labilibaculum euxinus]MWN76002.1 hypothetical protein [Labilibaculum euxinus]
MKLKFVSLGLLALSFVACDSYEESASVEAMRNARTEYVKAETGMINAQVAYEAARTKGQEIANAIAEAKGAVEIDKLKVQLEEAMADLEQSKAYLEYYILQQKNNIENLENNAISFAYNDYTIAYNDWTTNTAILLSEQNSLKDYNIYLAGAKMADENWADKQTKVYNLNLTGYNATLEEYNASLAMYKALQESNDWDAVKVELDAKRVELQELQAEEHNLGVDVNLASTKEGVAYNALATWMSDNFISSSIVRGEGVTEMAADFNTHKATLENDTIAPYNDMDAAKTAVEADGAEDADDYNVLVETYNNSVVVYNDAIAAYKAYQEAVLMSELKALNSTYVAACTKSDALQEEYAVIYAKRYALNSEVNNLSSLYFTIETNLYSGAEYTATVLAGMISNVEYNITFAQNDIDNIEANLANIEAGNYSQAQVVRSYEETIASIEKRIAEYMVKVETSKAWLDAKEAAYQALLN